MVAQPLRSTIPSLPFDRLEHARHLPRVVSGPRHDLCAKEIRLPLVLATVLQKVGAEADLRPLGDHAACAAADDGAEDLPGHRANLKLLPLRRLRRAVAQDDVAQLVRHHAGHFTFGSRSLQHAAVQEHRTTGKRERIDVAQVDDVERVAERRLAELRGNLLDQPLSDVLDVVLGALIVQ